MALINIQNKFLEIRALVDDIEFHDSHISEGFKMEYSRYIEKSRANGYVLVEWTNDAAKITSSSGKQIYAPNFWFHLAYNLADYLDVLRQYRELFKAIYQYDDLSEKAKALKSGVAEQDKNLIRDYFDKTGYSKEEFQSFLLFVSDYKSWGGGKTIDRNDYYVSPLLQAGNLLAETQSAIAEIAKQMSENQNLKGMFGSSKKANTKSTNNKCAEEIILFSKSIRDFVKSVFDYLFLNGLEHQIFSCIEIKGESGKYYSYDLVRAGRKIYKLFLASTDELTDVDLISGAHLRYHRVPYSFDGKYLYLTNQWADTNSDAKSSRDLGIFATIFNSIYKNIKITKDDGHYRLIKISTNGGNFINLSKPFLLFAGISGTGKTRFIREQAKASGAFPSTYCLTSVRPDWHEPSDLLGYISRLSGNAEYITTDVLKFIAKAWRAIADADLNIVTESRAGQDFQVKVCGERGYLDRVLPYWLCLDEMNLAPVEQYFADYLSVIETREWHWNGDEFTYMSDALLKPAFIAELSDESKQKLRDDLGFSEEKYAELWGIISQYGMGIPFNLMVAGTVNMDETTHGFSRKVIDRALSFDFGEFFPNNYNDFFSPSDRVKRLSYPTLSNVTQADLTGTIDSDGKQSIAFLSGVNEVLRKTPFELAYRALNELLLAVASVKPQDKLTLTAVWDDFVMCKVLPRIEGDTDKLQDAEGRSLLTELQTQLTKYFAALEEPTDTSEQRLRPDLYREKIIGDNTHEQDGLIYIPFRSTAKLAWMIKRLESSSFTSFWP